MQTGRASIAPDHERGVEKTIVSWTWQCVAHLIVQLVGHGGFRSSGPFSTFLEVLLNQRPVGSVLKEASPPGHRSLNDLIPHNNEDIPGHSCIHACAITA